MQAPRIHDPRLESLTQDIEELRGIISRVSTTRESCPKLTEAGICGTGVTHVREGWRIIRMAPRHAFVLVTAAGTGEVFCDGQWRRLEVEAAYVMPSEIPHGYRNAPARRLASQRDEETAGWKYAWARIDAPEKYPALFPPGMEEPAIMRAPSYSLLAANLGLANEMERGEGDPHLTAVWCELIRSSLLRLASPLRMDPRLGKLWASINTRLGERWEIGRMSAVAGLSREHLRRLCTRQFGCSPHRRLRELRMQRACELLRTTTATLADIAAHIGFSDPFAFSQAFKREHGIAPSAYREQTDVGLRSGSDAV